VTQFLDNTANQRTDQWGGSAENHFRFGLEVLKAAKEVFGHNVVKRAVHEKALNNIPDIAHLQTKSDTESGD
jgi:2,4-dienoyl-CoA reductase-like NADH-dependent reductase (Old Yellow Enzyme family)